MLRRFPVAVVLVSFAAGQDRPTFRADVSQVHVDAEVLSKDGRVLTGLSQTDFRVFDQGQEQHVISFSAEEQSLDLILLFDTSGSMRSVVEKVAASARQALNELRRGDRVAVMTFTTSTRLVGSFTEDLDGVDHNVQQVLSLPFGGGTHIHAAVYRAAEYFFEDSRNHRRRAVLIITDNVGIRTLPEKLVVRELWEADALLEGLIVNNPGNKVRLAIIGVMAPYMLARVRGMKKISEETGGDTIHSDDPASAFPEMMRRIRSRYSLYYPMPEGKPGTWRTIRAELAPDTQQRFPGARVFARRGYRLN